MIQIFRLLPILCFVTALLFLNPKQTQAQTIDWKEVRTCSGQISDLSCKEPLNYFVPQAFTIDYQDLFISLKPSAAIKVEVVTEKKVIKPLVFPFSDTKKPAEVAPYPTSTDKKLLQVTQNITIPTPSPNVVPNPEKPTSIPVSVDNSSHPLSADIIFNLINQHRAKIGKPAFEKNEELCKVAQSRAPELYNEIFLNRNMHAGFYGRKLPYQATENMIHQQNEEAAVRWWLNSSVHRRAIESDRKYSCGACQGNSCAQIFSNLD